MSGRTPEERGRGPAEGKGERAGRKEPQKAVPLLAYRWSPNQEAREREGSRNASQEVFRPGRRVSTSRRVTELLVLLAVLGGLAYWIGHSEEPGPTPSRLREVAQGRAQPRDGRLLSVPGLLGRSSSALDGRLGVPYLIAPFSAYPGGAAGEWRCYRLPEGPLLTAKLLRGRAILFRLSLNRESGGLVGTPPSSRKALALLGLDPASLAPVSRRPLQADPGRPWVRVWRGATPHGSGGLALGKVTVRYGGPRAPTLLVVEAQARGARAALPARGPSGAGARPGSGVASHARPLSHGRARQAPSPAGRPRSIARAPAWRPAGARERLGGP